MDHQFNKTDQDYVMGIARLKNLIVSALKEDSNLTVNSLFHSDICRHTTHTRTAVALNELKEQGILIITKDYHIHLC